MKEAAERDYILRKLEETGGNVTRASELLGLERSNLYRKMRRSASRRKSRYGGIRAHDYLITGATGFIGSKLVNRLLGARADT